VYNYAECKVPLRLDSFGEKAFWFLRRNYFLDSSIQNSNMRTY
jgi:hypothetical protein